MRVLSSSRMFDALVQAILREFPGAQAIYVYGSAATGELRADSDIDLAILLPYPEAKSADALRLLPLRLELEGIAKRDVDLVNARTVSTVLQKEILQHGRVLYAADERARQEFEMLVLSQYQRLNEERADILRAFRETKRAYLV